MPRKHNSPPRNLARSPIDKAKAYEAVWNQVAPLFEAARPWTGVSFVYIIGEPDGPVKIGFSKDPVGRLRAMQTGNPRRLRIEYALVGAMDTEKLLHEFWESNAITAAGHNGLPGVAPGTEWFNPQARANLLPIVEKAVEAQVGLLNRVAPPTSFAELDQAVRDAHMEAGFIPTTYAPTIRLAAGAGYAISRRSRI